MSMFGEYAEDISEAPDDPFSLPDGSYHGAIIGVEVRSGAKDDGKPWSGTEFTLSAEGEDRDAKYFLTHPQPHDSAMVRDLKLSSIKKFLQGCEVPPNEMDSVQPEDLIGLEVDYIVSHNKKGFMNLELKLSKGSPVSQGNAKPVGNNAAEEDLADLFDI